MSNMGTLARVGQWKGWHDLRTWVGLIALIQLIGITHPPLETAHHWRQTTVTMVARNFHEGGLDLLHPRVDMAGERSGITGMEVPLLPAAIAAVSKVFGYHHGSGRIIVLLCHLMGLLAFRRLVLTYTDARTAFWSTLMLGVSLWFSYGRKIMPDVPSMALVIGGLALAGEALHGRGPWSNGFLAGVTLALGTAVKLPAGYLLVLLPAMVLVSDRSVAQRAALLAWIALLQLPVLWWYFHWVPHLEALGGYSHFFMGTSWSQGLQELLLQPVRVLDNFYFDALRFSGALLALIGLALAIFRRNRALLWTTVLASLGFGVIMLSAGAAFWKHAYYIIPFVPVMALLAGSVVAAIPDQRWRIVLMGVVALEGIANQWQDLRPSPVQTPLLALEADLDRFGGREDLIVVNSGSIPTPMYFAHRKGWTVYSDAVRKGPYLDSLHGVGARWYVELLQGYEVPVTVPYPVVLERKEYRIHRLGH